ncbi:MAG: M23 family metallopeptidase [Muribaculaceae bacterium]|nr:M23 family metallopeptidase [Muribaculaceae bacterium]
MTRRKKYLKKVRYYVRNIFEGISLAFVLVIILYFCLDRPREEKLKNENIYLKSELEELNRRLDVSISVMEDIANRDNNFYRVMLQADPISDARRYAGLENSSTYGKMNDLDDLTLVNTVNDKMRMLERLVYSQSLSFDTLRTIAGERQDRLSHIPSIQPISHNDMKTMASGYGYRIDPIYGTGKFHEGMDFSAAVGTPVYATGDGVVVKAGWNSGYGNSIDIDHGYDYLTRFAHLSKVYVKTGQEIKRGDLIGLVGNTGKSTGPHLHYEVRYKGVPQNPVRYYFQDLTPEQYIEMIAAAESASHVMD